MEEKQRIEHAQRIHLTTQKLVEEKKAIGDKIKSTETDIDTNMGDHELKWGDDVVKYVKGLYTKRKKLISNRQEYNAKIKNLKSDLESCLFGKGKFDKDQLHFPFDDEDVVKYADKVKKAKVKPKDKVEDTEDLD